MPIAAVNAAVGMRGRPLPITGGLPPEVTLVSRYPLDQAEAPDDFMSVDGTVVGVWDDFPGSLVVGNSGSSFYKDGGNTAHITLPAAQVQHNLANLSISFYYQPVAHLTKHTLIAWGNSAPGDGSIEVLTNGRIRGYHVGSDGGLRYFESTNGVAATNLLIGTAYRITITFGTTGARLYVNNTEVASIMQNTNGWNNTVVKYIGVWTNGTSSPMEGVIDHLRIWNGQLGSSGVAALEAAQSVTLEIDESITLLPIYAWANSEGVGEFKNTDNDVGGTIASASGGTLPAFPITIDPTPFVSGATGNKGDWDVEFRTKFSSPPTELPDTGAWTQDGSGDLVFTPHEDPGYNFSEYRISDDGGATWSAWQDIEALVLDRALAPGPYFLIEDYAGTNIQKLDAARDAAFNAGGGTVTTLLRDTVLTNIDNHAPKARVNYLFCNLKKSTAQQSPTNDFCSVNGDGQCSGWSTNEQTNIITTVPNRTSLVDSGVALNFVGGVFDGNAFTQALHVTSGDNSNPSSNCGTCWPGDRTSPDAFNLQFAANFRLRGKDDTGINAANRLLFGAYGILNKESVSDGFRCAESVAGTVEDCIISATFRGAFLWDGGNSTLFSHRNRMIEGPNNVGSGIDHETVTSGSQYLEILHENDWMDADFDAVLRSTSTMTFNGCKMGPGINLISRTSSGSTFLYQGSQEEGGRVRGLIRFHQTGGGTTTSFPRSGIFGWNLQGPHNTTFTFKDTDFETEHAPYVYHAQLRTPANGQTWEIELGQTVDTTSSFRVELINCIVRKVGTHTGTYRLFRTVKALTTTQVVYIDGLTIEAGFLQAAIQLNGQRLEYRNVVHLGFPSATIQDICPGAGSYVQIGGSTEPPPPPANTLGTVTPIADNNHPNLLYTDAEIVALRALVSGGTIPQLTQRFNAIRNVTAQTIPTNWPSSYQAGSARVARGPSHNNLKACLSYAIEPTTAKANAMRSAINDLKNRYPPGKRGDLNFGSWHLPWAWMFDLIQAYHPGHYTSGERDAIKEWFGKCANIGNSIRNLASRHSLLTHSEYRDSDINNSSRPLYDRIDGGKRVTFYTNWYSRALASTGAAALVSGSQSQVDFYFQSWWPQYHDILHKGQITETPMFPPNGLNRFDIGMYALSIHPHGECSDTWQREGYGSLTKNNPHTTDETFFTSGNQGKYHQSTLCTIYMAAEMAYRNGMTGIFNLTDSFASPTNAPLIRLGFEFMRDHRNSLDRSGGGTLVAMGYHKCAMAWSRYNTTKINELLTLCNNQTTQSNDDGGEFPDDFTIIYRYPRRLVGTTPIIL